MFSPLYFVDSKSSLLYSNKCVVLTVFSRCSHRLSKLCPTDLSAFRGLRPTQYIVWLLRLALSLPAAPVAFPTSGSDPIVATAAFFYSSALATRLPPQATAETSSAPAVVALTTRAMASVSTDSGCKRSRDEVRFLRAYRVCNGGKLLQTRLEIRPIGDLADPPVDGATRNEQETAMIAALYPASSPASALKMVVPICMSCFRYWQDGSRFLIWLERCAI